MAADPEASVQLHGPNAAFAEACKASSAMIGNGLVSIWSSSSISRKGRGGGGGGEAGWIG